MKKFLKRLLKSLLVLFILILVIIGFFLFTQSGLKLSLSLAQNFLPGTLTVKNYSGKLIGPLSISGLDYQDKQTHINVKSFYLDWKPRDLFENRLHIDSLKIADANIHLATSKPSKKQSSSSGSTTISLPMAFTIKQLQISNLKVQQGHKNLLAIKTASVKAKSDDNTIKIQEFKIDGNPYSADVHGQIDLSELLDTNLSGSFTHQMEDYPAVTTDFHIKGNTDKVSFGISIKKPYQAVLKGSLIRPFQEGPINITGKWKNFIWAINPESAISSPKGLLKVSGTLKHYTIALKTNVQKTDQPKVAIDLQANGNWFSAILNSLKLQALGGTLTVSGKANWKNYLSWQATATAKNFNLAKQWDGAPSALGFTLNAKAHNGSGLQINLNNLKAVLNGHKVTGAAQISQQDNNWLIQGLRFTSGNSALIAQGKLGKKSNLELTLNAKNLSHFYNGIAGQLNATAKVTGSLSKPIVNANISGQNFLLDPPGISLKSIKLKLTTNNTGILKLNGTVSGAKGKPLTLSGQANLFKGFSPATVNIQGKDVQLFDSHQYDIALDPDLQIKFDKPKLDITGSIHIAHAIVRLGDFSNTVELPSSLEIVKAQDEEKEQPIQTHIHVKATLGSPITLQYDGLKAELAGGVTINMKPQQLTTAVGALTVTKGYYKAYGADLKIANGTLIYTGGSLLNPGINLLATKTITVDKLGVASGFDNDNIVVGVQVTGSIRNMKVSLYSSPGMSNSDILSYLLFGLPSDKVSDSKLQVIGRAASAFGLSGDSFTGDLQSELGLDQLGIESGQVVNPETGEVEQNTSFVVGKKLSKRLSVSYSAGILVPVNIFKARYQLGENWAVQGDASTYGSGGDLLYTIDTN
jgi:translocation and assembly module TamB